MEISRKDILGAIMTLETIGKKLPMGERIKGSANPAKAKAELLDTLVQTWHDVFLPMHIGVDRWKRAVNVACLTNTPNSQIITPGLMRDCLKQVEQEQLHEQEAKYATLKQEEKETASETTKAVQKALGKWFSLMAKRKGKNRFGYRPTDDKVMEMAKERLGLTEQEITDNMVILKCWASDLLYAEDNGTTANSTIAFNDDGTFQLAWVD